MIPKTIVTPSARNPNADPTTAPAIVAFAEDCWRESVGDGFNDVNDDGACDVVIPENEFDDEVLSATHSESTVRGRSYKGHVAYLVGLQFYTRT